MILIIIALLSWSELCVGFFGISDVITPSNEDVSEAYNLTSWITNQTSREILRQYITLCPGQDMCHGDIFTRKYAFDIDMVPSCTPCDCDDSCVRKSTCCPSKFLRIENRSATNGETQEKDNLKKPPLVCVQPLLNKSIAFNVKGYWLVKGCPNGDPCDTLGTDLISSTPVTSISTKETYLNVECALCNNESALNLIFWEQNQVLCQDRASLLHKRTYGNLSEMIPHLFPNCDVLFYPPSTITELIIPCVFVLYKQEACTYPGVLSDERSYLLHACNSYHLPYSNCYGTYNNVFCVICQTPTIKGLPIQCKKDVSFSTYPFPKFSALMDFAEDRETDVVSHDRSCGAGQVYDKRMNECLEVTCGAEYVLKRNLECRPMYPEWGENNYEVNMIFRPTHEVDEVYLRGMPYAIKVFLEIRMSRNNITKYLCSIRIFRLVENGIMYFGGHIELTVNHGHDIDKMIDKFTQIFSIDHAMVTVISLSLYNVNISSFILGQTFYAYKNIGRFDRTCHFIHPVSSELIKPSSSSDFSHIRRFCIKQSPTAIIVAEWYRCPKIKITTADKIEHKNFSLCLVDQGHCIPSRYFKKSFNNLQFDVCVDWYIRSSTQVFSDQTTPGDLVNIYLSLVCLTLSSVGSMMTIISYLIKKERVNVPETNVLILCVFLIIANTIYTFSIFFQWNETLCVIVGMLVHFFWLSVVFWMSLCSFKVFETFTNFAVIKLRQTSDICCRLVINLLLCLTLVGTNIIVSHIESDGQRFGYSPLTCYIEKSKMILYTFTLPVGVTVCINIFMFLVTVSRIHNKGDVRKSKDQEKVSAYFRLSTLTGMSWLFGFLAQFTNLQVFSFFHTVFSASQGVFIYFAFGRQRVVSCKCVKDCSLEI